MNRKPSLAFIDGQNLHLGTMQSGWKINYVRFRTYLRDKYGVKEARYFFGVVDESEKDLYENLRKAGFTVCFREHYSALKATKKGNVDTDIVFEIMRVLIERDDFESILLVSGDGDYKKLVDYLIKKGRFKKILFPNKKYASSLYKRLAPEYFDYLENQAVKEKIEHLKKERSP